MKSKTFVSAITAAAVAFGSVGAIAQPRGESQRQFQNDRRGPPPQRVERPQRPDARHQYRGEQYRGQQYRGQQYRNDAYRRHDQARPYYRPGPPPPHARAGGRGAGPYHDIYRGARLPSYYRSPMYVVSDWRGHHLRPPPRGYYWVQVGADYLLVAIATGIVVQLMLGY